MAESIIALFDKYPDVVIASIDETLQQLSASGQSYRRGLPDPYMIQNISMNRYVTARLAIQKVKERKPLIANIVAIDGEIPVKKEPVALSMETLNRAKLARARLFDEMDFELMHEAEILLRGGNEDAYNAYIDGFMTTPASLIQSLQILAYKLAVEVLCTGQCTYVDPETELGYSLDYTDQIPAAHRPAAPATLWSNAAATPLENLADHLNSYYASMYMLPPAIVMTSTVADAMLDAPDTKEKLGRLNGRLTTESDPAGPLGSMPRPTLEEVRGWLAREITTGAQGSAQVPQMVVSDAVYFTLNADGTVNDTPTLFIPNDTYFFMGDDFVEGALLPTATNDFANNFAVTTEELSKNPRRELATADTKYVVLCPDPRKLGFRTVL